MVAQEIEATFDLADVGFWRNLGLTRLRLRGLTGARDEFLLAATVQNLKRLVKLAAIPPPIPITA